MFHAVVRQSNATPVSSPCGSIAISPDPTPSLLADYTKWPKIT